MPDFEAVLTRLWEDTLALSEVGAQADLFGELNATSADVLRVVTLVQRELAVDIPAEALFAASTISGQAKALADHVAQTTAGGQIDASAIEATGKVSAPANAMQVVCWDMDREDPLNPSLRGLELTRLTGAIDASALERALAQIARDHDSLRATYREVDGELHQFAPAAEPKIALERIDVSGLAETDRQPRIDDAIRELTQRAFDLAAGPVFRAALIRLGADDHILAIVAHHIAMDAGSWPVLRRDLAARYREQRSDGRRTEPAPALGFLDYADHLAGHASSPEGRAQSEYWTQKLAGAPALELRTDLPRKPLDGRRDAAVRGVVCTPELVSLGEIPAETRARIAALGREQKTTESTVLLAALVAVLHRWTGQTDLCIATPHSHRHILELENVIGCVGNPLILRADASGRPSFRELVRRMAEVVLASYRHGKARVFDWTPHGIRRVSYNYVPMGKDGLDPDRFGDGLLAQGLPRMKSEQRSPSDIRLLILASDALQLRLGSSAELFHQKTSDELLLRYTGLVTEATLDPSLPV